MLSGTRPNAAARRELDAAGITDPQLRTAYYRCRRLNAQHGRTYFLATRLLTTAQRPPIHALYGFARWVDDLVDDLSAPARRAELHQMLDQVEQELKTGLEGLRTEHPVLAAVSHTAARHAIEPALFSDFMTSMRMDLTVHEYPTREALNTYVHGSAAVIGLQVLPVLGTVCPQSEAAPYATALGRAFQLTNFLRDVGEDLDRGRVYLPADELAAFGVDRERLVWCRQRGIADRKVQRALADQVARTPATYRFAEHGIALLKPCSRPCIATAFTLYQDILDRIVEADYNVFGGRAVVPNSRRAGVALAAMSAVLANRTANTGWWFTSWR